MQSYTPYSVLPELRDIEKVHYPLIANNAPVSFLCFIYVKKLRKTTVFRTAGNRYISVEKTG